MKTNKYHNNLGEVHDALFSISCPVSGECYDRWLKVGMALHSAGLPIELYDQWSQTEPNGYDPEEVRKKWDSFSDEKDAGVGLGTLFHMAEPCQAFTVNDTDPLEPVDPSPLIQRSRAMKVLYRPDEHLKIAKDASEQGLSTSPEELSKMEMLPSQTGWYMTANPLRAGAEHRKTEDIAEFRYAVIESDTMSIAEQMNFYRSHWLPIAAVVYSGSRSAQAFVRIDAGNDKAVFDEREKQLHEYLKSHGFEVDDNCRSVTRLCRLPGADRNGTLQAVLALEMGATDWETWREAVEALEPVEDEKAANLASRIRSAVDMLTKPEPLPPAVIDGVLRKGGVMLVTSESKAGKSMLMLELAAALATGGDWLGFSCRPTKTLYLDFEVQPAQLDGRASAVCNALGIAPDQMHNLDFIPMRGVDIDPKQLMSQLMELVRAGGYGFVILDPLYKFFEGDENSAQDTSELFRNLDKVASGGASVAFVHHHSKGGASYSNSANRGSGSGVFNRAPDAIIDLSRLSWDADERTGWQVSFTLRSFKSAERRVFFEYPIHHVDDEGLLESCRVVSPQYEGGKKSGEQRKTAKEDAQRAFVKFVKDYTTEHGEGPTVAEAREAVIDSNGRQRTDKTFRNWCNELGLTVKSNRITI